MSSMHLVGSRMLQCAEKAYITRVYRYPKKNGGFIHTAETVLDSGDNIVSDGNTIEECPGQTASDPAAGVIFARCLAARDRSYADPNIFKQAVINRLRASGLRCPMGVSSHGTPESQRLSTIPCRAAVSRMRPSVITCTPDVQVREYPPGQ